MRIFLFIFVFCAISEARSHQDTNIMLSEEGDLVGLPKSYHPASFNRDNGMLTIGNNTYTFPECLSELFSMAQITDIELSSSWYHKDKASIPSYLSIGILSKGIGVLINLDTLKPFYIKAVEFEGNNVVTYQELSKEEICLTLKNKT